MKGVIAALVLALTTTAAAGEPSSVAAERFKRGAALVEQHRFVEAYGEFEQGYRLSGRPLFLYNMGECARAADNDAQARAAYQRYLREAPDGKLAATVRERLAEPAAVAVVTPPPRPLPLQATDEPPSVAPTETAIPLLPTPAKAANLPSAQRPNIEDIPVAAPARPAKKSRYWMAGAVAVAVVGAVLGVTLAELLPRNAAVPGATRVTFNREVHF